MDFESALRARLKAGLGSVSLPTTVEWGKRPQGRFPAVRLTVVGTDLSRHMTGFGSQRRTRVQIDAMALDKGAAVALREGVLAVICAAGVVDGSGSSAGQRVRFWAAQGVSVADQSEDADGEFVFREMIDAVIYWQLEN